MPSEGFECVRECLNASHVISLCASENFEDIVFHLRSDEEWSNMNASRLWLYNVQLGEGGVVAMLILAVVCGVHNDVECVCTWFAFENLFFFFLALRIFLLTFFFSNYYPLFFFQVKKIDDEHKKVAQMSEVLPRYVLFLFHLSKRKRVI